MNNYDDLFNTMYSNIKIPQNQAKQNGIVINKIFNHSEEKHSKIKKLIPLITLPPIIFTLSFAACKSNFNLSSVGINNPTIESLTENEIMKINTEVQEFEGLSVNVTKFYEDNTNFLIEIQATSSKYDLSKTDDVYIRNLSIYDEQENQIYLENENESINKKNILNMVGFTKANKDGDKIYFTFFGTSENLPSSNKIFVKFDGIDLVNKRHKAKTYNGNWNFEFDIK